MIAAFAANPDPPSCKSCHAERMPWVVRKPEREAGSNCKTCAGIGVGPGVGVGFGVGAESTAPLTETLAVLGPLCMAMSPDTEPTGAPRAIRTFTTPPLEGSVRAGPKPSPVRAIWKFGGAVTVIGWLIDMVLTAKDFEAPGLGETALSFVRLVGVGMIAGLLAGLTVP